MSPLRCAPADMKDAEVMLADASFRALADQPADLSVQLVALPLRPNDMAGGVLSTSMYESAV